VGILLFLTLGLAVVMAYQAWDATRSHERIAHGALQEHALSAAWQLTSTIERELLSWYFYPGLEAVAKSGGVYVDRSLATTKFFEKTVMDFGGGLVVEGLDFLFRLDLYEGKLEVEGLKGPGPEAAQWLRNFLKEAATGKGAGPKLHSEGIRFIGEPGEERVLVFRIYPDAGPSARIAYGFQSDLTPVKRIVSEVAQKAPLLPPALQGGMATPDVLSLTVGLSDGREIFRSIPQYDSKVVAEDTVDASLGGLLGSVRINPKAAEKLVIGGLPKSRLPMILGVLALTSALIIVAIFQLRREQELALLRTDFVSSVSHQLRTPLAQIRMFGETLLLGRVRSQEEEDRSLEIIVKEAQRLTHQVDNVLHFSRAQRGEVSLSLGKTLLAPLVSEVLESFCPLAEAQDCRVEPSLDPALEAWVDTGAFRQILLNLLENAVKYGPQDQIIDVRLRKGPGGTVQLIVEDEGEGVPEDQRREIFSPYSRLERDRDSGVAGSGIGLAVVKELAERQGASVRVDDSLSGGASFIVAFPPEPPAAIH
jgi:signal transduction histidine kinase